MMKNRISTSLIFVAVLFVPIVITIGALLLRSVNVRASLRDTGNDSVFLPLILSAQQSEGSVFTELATDVDLSDEQQNILNVISTDPSIVQVSLVTSDNSLLRTAQYFQLNILSDVTLNVTTDRVDIRSDVDFTWYGSNSATQTNAVIVVNGNDTTGTVINGNDLYKILPVGDGVHANTKIDIAQLDADHPAEFDEVQRETLSRQSTFLDSQSTIRMLVSFTPAADREVGNINALIQLAIDETNMSFINSGVNKNIQLVYVYETLYSETGNMSRDLERLRIPNDGFMDEALSLRNTYSADVVMLIGSRNYGYCGMASTILADYNSAFALVAQHCATGYYTFGHELGHLLGARHNPEVDPSTSPFVYGHGYYPPSQNWRTVMSYNCPNGCVRLPYWSNPDIFYHGEQMGTAARHNNAQVLNRDSSVPPTPTATDTPTPTATDTPTPTATNTPTPTATDTPTPTATNTPTPTATNTPTPIATDIPSPTATNTPTPTATNTPPPPCEYGPYNLPYHLQFENYTCGGEGIAYHDADPGNNGNEYRLDEAVDLGVSISSGWGNSYFVGWTEADEWLKYEVYIDYPGTYYFNFFVSSLYDSGRFHLEIDGVDITGTLIVPNTGGEQNWQTILTPEGTFLAVGHHTFKLVIESGGGNFDFLRTFPATPTPMPTATATASPAELIIVSVPELLSTPPIIAYQPVSFMVTISNTGDIPVNDLFFIDLFFDPEPAIVSTMVRIPITQSVGHTAISSLAGQTSRAITITSSGGFANTPSTYLVYAMVDSTESVSEYGETNNISDVTIVDNVEGGIEPTPTQPPVGGQKIHGYVFRPTAGGAIKVLRAILYLYINGETTPLRVTESSNSNGYYSFDNTENGTYSMLACSSIDGGTIGKLVAPITIANGGTGFISNPMLNEVDGDLCP